MLNALVLPLALLLLPCQDADSLWKSGREKFRDKDYEGAIADLTKVIELAPKFVPAYTARARAKDDKGDFDGAIADYTRALNLEPSADLYTQRGYVKERYGDAAGAVADYTKAIDLDPKNADLYSFRGFAYFDLKDYDAAIQDFTTLVEMDPKNTGYLSSRASAKSRKLDYAGAIRDLTKAIEIAPDKSLGELYNSRGHAHYDNNSLPEALADLRKACEHSTLRSHSFKRSRIWLIRAKLGEKNDATQELREHAAKPEVADVWNTKVCLYLTGDLTERELLKASEEPATDDPRTGFPRLREAYYFIGSRHLIEGDKAGALTLLQKCVHDGIQSYADESALAELRRLKAEK